MRWLWGRLCCAFGKEGLFSALVGLRQDFLADHADSGQWSWFILVALGGCGPLSQSKAPDSACPACGELGWAGKGEGSGWLPDPLSHSEIPHNALQGRAGGCFRSTQPSSVLIPEGVVQSPHLPGCSLINQSTSARLLLAWRSFSGCFCAAYCQPCLHWCLPN